MTPEERGQWITLAAHHRELAREARDAGKWGKAREHDQSAAVVEGRIAEAEAKAREVEQQMQEVNAHG